MWYYSKEIRITFFSLVASLFLLSGVNSGFSQEPFPEISDEDLDLLEELLEEADDLFDEENYEEAILLYSLAIGIDPTDIDALFGMAESLENLGRYEAAILYYDLILAIDSSDPDALDGKALALESLISEEEPFPEISDEDLELLEELLEEADDLFDEENYHESIIYYDQVLAIDSSDIDALNGKALALDTIGKHEEAITYYDAVLAIGSSDIEALNGKALALYNLGKHEEAITYFDAVLVIDSTDDDALFGKALALEGLGREHEAIPLLEQVIEQAPPESQFRVPPEGTVNQNEFVQTLFVIIGVVIVILTSIILIDFIARKRKTVTNIETPIAEQQVISSKPSSDSTSQKIDDSGPEKKDTTTSLEVEQAIKVLQNLTDMNMLDDPKTVKQFLLMKGFSKNAVKNAMIAMGIDPSNVADLE